MLWLISYVNMFDVKQDKIKEIGSRVSGGKEGVYLTPSLKGSFKTLVTTRRAEKFQGVQGK